MKLRTLIFSAAAIAMTVACDRNEIPDPFESGDVYTINSQEQVASFKGSDDINTLTIEGEEITDLSALNVNTLKNLIIKNTSITELNVPALKSASASIQIVDNAKLKSMKGLTNLKFVGGKFLIQGNPVLEDISGIMGIKVFNGKLQISGNSVLGENVVPLPSDAFGFGPIRKLIIGGVIDAKNVILENNHPDAVTDASLIGIPVGVTIIDYTLKSKADIEKFQNFDPEGIVNNLTINGADIDDAAMNSLIGKITEVRGTFTLENVKANNTFKPDNGGFFGAIKFKGSIVLRNLTMNNINSFKGLNGTLPGDLIIENCNNLDFQWDSPYPNGAGFQNVLKIGGSLIIRNCDKFHSTGFANLTEIGKDLVIEGVKSSTNRKFYDFVRMKNLKKIGGDISIKDNALLNSFFGLENLTYIGSKNITIKADVALKNAGDGTKPGFGYFKWALENKVIVNKDCKFDFSTLDGTKIDFAKLEASKN